MQISGKEALIEGKLIRIARLEVEGYQFVEDPETALRTLKDSGIRADLFTFIQKLSETSPKHEYPMEWDNMAALRVSSFEDWMNLQIDFKARNKVRKAEKRGVVVREMPFDDFLVRGISAISDKENSFGTTGRTSRPCAEWRGLFWTKPSSSARFWKVP
jgi:hypothetical protein